MSWTDVLSKPWRANRRVATLRSRSFTGVRPPGRPTDSLDLTAMRHAPLFSGLRVIPAGRSKVRQANAAWSTRTSAPAWGDPRVLPEHPHSGGQPLRMPVPGGELSEVHADVRDPVAGPVAARPAATLLPRPRPGQRPVLQSRRVQPAQVRSDPALQR